MNPKAAEMYERYKNGLSLAQVGELYGVTRQSVYSMFECRGWEMRKLPGIKEYLEFNGEKYTIGIHGYYRKTGGNRNLMHRDVWEYYNSPIPKGWDIHHKDENKRNNDIKNLECLPKAEHTRLYSPHNNQYTKGRKKNAVT